MSTTSPSPEPRVDSESPALVDPDTVTADQLRELIGTPDRSYLAAQAVWIGTRVAAARLVAWRERAAEYARQVDELADSVEAHRPFHRGRFIHGFIPRDADNPSKALRPDNDYAYDGDTPWVPNKRSKAGKELAAKIKKLHYSDLAVDAEDPGTLEGADKRILDNSQRKTFYPTVSTFGTDVPLMVIPTDAEDTGFAPSVDPKVWTRIPLAPFIALVESGNAPKVRFPMTGFTCTVADISGRMTSFIPRRVVDMGVDDRTIPVLYVDPAQVADLHVGDSVTVTLTESEERYAPSVHRAVTLEPLEDAVAADALFGAALHSPKFSVSVKRVNDA
ncbi:hypothetical protein [Corynebacterium sp. AOP12-C2-36]|uniref:hypothetical protein n=1 Tax=Corynebacterium sp. AOP12-C2-36 TaxID=3457723 RepID=UPI00403347D1